MAKTIARLEAQIAQLQRQADALRAKEREGVIERINVAIKHYEIVAEDLEFGSQGSKAKKHKKMNGRKPSRTKKKTVGRIKFRDERGNAWTGHGRAPAWYKEALASGKTRQDLAVSS